MEKRRLHPSTSARPSNIGPSIVPFGYETGRFKNCDAFMPDRSRSCRLQSYEFDNFGNFAAARLFVATRLDASSTCVTNGGEQANGRRNCPRRRDHLEWVEVKRRFVVNQLGSRLKSDACLLWHCALPHIRSPTVLPFL